AGDAAGLCFEAGERTLLGFLQARTRLLDLILGASTRLVHGIGSRLQSLLASRLLALENLLASFPKALLVVGSPRLSGSNSGAGFLNRSLGAVAPLRQNSRERLVNQERIEDRQEGKQNNGRNGAEQ